MNEVKSNGLYTNAHFVTNQDGWANIFTGMGYSQRDKRLSTKVSLAQRFDCDTLTELYRGDGIGKRIVDIPAKDMVREWFNVLGDTDGLINNDLKKIYAPKQILKALKWSRLYGGSLAVLFVNDGQDLDMEVNKNNIKAIEGIEVFDRWEVTWGHADLYQNTRNQKYGLPELYTVTNSSTGSIFKVHESRVLRFDGEELPNRAKRDNQGWGDSVITAVYDRLRGLNDSYASIEVILQEFIIGILSIDNLQSLIGTDGGSQAVQKRLQLLDMSRHILNSYLIDSKESFDRVSSSGTQGMATLIDKLELALCGISGIPKIKLFPEQTKGLGGEASGNLRLYYDDIKADQELILEPEIRKLIEYIQISKEGPFRGVRLDDWGIEFCSLWQPTEKEKAETRKITAETDDIYNQIGLSSDVILESRFGGEKYSMETVLPDDFQPIDNTEEVME